MSWWIWIIVIVVVLMIIGGMLSGEESIKSNNKSKSTGSNKSSKIIAEEVITIAHLRSLERKLERADEQRQQHQTSIKAEEKADEKYQTLQDAFDIALNKILRWQFIPNIDLETPLALAKNAYKVFPASEYEHKKREIGGSTDEWYELRGDEDPDEKDEEIKFVIKFRTIIENPELSDEEISKKINSLVSRNKSEASNFFDIDDKIKPAEQWREISA